MERKYVMVRAMTSQPIHFQTFFDNSVVAVGWSNIDFSICKSDEELREKVKAEYYSETSGPLVSKNINECVRFNHLSEGDYVIVPYYSGIALATIEKEKIYSKEAISVDLANQHKVSYQYKNGAILSVPRNDLSEGLQRRLRVPGMSVSDLSEFSEEIDKLFENPESYSYSNEVKQKEDEMQRSFKRKLLENIQSGKTNLQTGGIGMENLVKELFECQGYNAKVLAKTSFAGDSDADVEAWRDDDFTSVKIFAQVKHHSGFTGKTGINQVIGAIKEGYEDHIPYFITSGEVSEDVRNYAEENNVNVVDGNKLADMIFDNLSKLSGDTKKKLGIVMVPNIF